MLIGITCDLRDDYLAEGFSPEETAEFDKAETVEAIEDALAALGHYPIRIGNIRKLGAWLQAGSRCDLVFNIAEGLHGMGREAQVPALLDAYRIPYTFSETHVLALALHKGFTKAVVRQAGVPTADFLTIGDPGEIDRVSISYPLFVKPAGGGTSMGIDEKSVVHNRRELETAVRRQLERFQQPVLVEACLTGREFTVGILGTGRKASAVGTAEILVDPSVEGRIYSYTAKQQYKELARYIPADYQSAGECEAIALKVWDVLGCRDAGRVDIKMDAAGRPLFLEVNPLAGLHPIDSDLPIICRLQGISYQELIGEIVDSALSRIFPVDEEIQTG